MQPSNPIDTLEPIKAIAPQDRCDSCNAKAFYMVRFTSGDLLFCRHHFVKNEDAFLEKACDIFDDTDYLGE
jgi:hypothetical protein